MARFFSKKGRASSGFTLVELLVSMGIIGVITGQMLANYRGGQRYSELRFAADILVTQLRSVQTNAIAGRLVGVCTGGVQDGEVCEVTKSPAVACTSGACDKKVPTGYGIRFNTSEPTSFLVFFDTDGDALYDVGEELSTQPYISTGVVEFTSSNEIIPVDIVFEPPFGRIYFNGTPAGPNSVEITLKHKNGPEERHVTINRITGRIQHD